MIPLLPKVISTIANPGSLISALGTAVSFIGTSIFRSEVKKKLRFLYGIHQEEIDSKTEELENLNSELDKDSINNLEDISGLDSEITDLNKKESEIYGSIQSRLDSQNKKVDLESDLEEVKNDEQYKTNDELSDEIDEFKNDHAAHHQIMMDLLRNRKTDTTKIGASFIESQMGAGEVTPRIRKTRSDKGGHHQRRQAIKDYNDQLVRLQKKINSEDAKVEQSEVSLSTTTTLTDKKHKIEELERNLKRSKDKKERNFRLIEALKGRSKKISDEVKKDTNLLLELPVVLSDGLLIGGLVDSLTGGGLSKVANLLNDSTDVIGNVFKLPDAVKQAAEVYVPKAMKVGRNILKSVGEFISDEYKEDNSVNEIKSIINEYKKGSITKGKFLSQLSPVYDKWLDATADKPITDEMGNFAAEMQEILGDEDQKQFIDWRYGTEYIGDKPLSPWQYKNLVDKEYLPTFNSLVSKGKLDKKDADSLKSEFDKIYEDGKHGDQTEFKSKFMNWRNKVIRVVREQAFPNLELTSKYDPEVDFLDGISIVPIKELSILPSKDRLSMTHMGPLQKQHIINAYNRSKERYPEVQWDAKVISGYRTTAREKNSAGATHNIGRALDLQVPQFDNDNNKLSQQERAKYAKSLAFDLRNELGPNSGLFRYVGHDAGSGMHFHLEYLGNIADKQGGDFEGDKFDGDLEHSISRGYIKKGENQLNFNPKSRDTGSEGGVISIDSGSDKKKYGINEKLEEGDPGTMNPVDLSPITLQLNQLQSNLIEVMSHLALDGTQEQIDPAYLSTPRRSIAWQ